jgi:hypothetical protein
VSICGAEFPFSILAIIGCLTPLNCSKDFWESPFACRNFINSLMIVALKLLSAISCGVKISFSKSPHSSFANLLLVVFLFFNPPYKVL